MTQNEIYEAIQQQNEIILDREARLRQKDYIGTKIAMGVAKIADYKDVITQTETWRADINAAQEEIARLEALIPDEQEEVAPMEEV